jgi:hypothetical protein
VCCGGVAGERKITDGDVAEANGIENKRLATDGGVVTAHGVTRKRAVTHCCVDWTGIILLMRVRTRRETWRGERPSPDSDPRYRRRVWGKFGPLVNTIRFSSSTYPRNSSVIGSPSPTFNGNETNH